MKMYKCNNCKRRFKADGKPQKCPKCHESLGFIELNNSEREDESHEDRVEVRTNPEREDENLEDDMER